MKNKYLKLNDQEICLTEVKDFTDKNDLQSINITLQSKPVKEIGVNGLQIDDAIIAIQEIVKSFNEKNPCFESEMVILKLKEAKLWCDKRKQDRINRGVEGTNKT
jgi:hypothetical protein